MQGIAHIGLWVSDLERSREFYTRYFDGNAGPKYSNPKKGFESYFITFGNGASLEIMTRTDITAPAEKECLGPAHIAFAAENREEVDRMTEKLRRDGFRIAGEPRVTGDGYYEAVVADPDGTLIELVV